MQKLHKICSSKGYSISGLMTKFRNTGNLFTGHKYEEIMK